MARSSAAPSARTRVKRVHDRAVYDRTRIDEILDAALICHLGFEQDGQPYVIPTLHARIGDLLYVHGSAASRTLRALVQARDADAPGGRRMGASRHASSLRGATDSGSSSPRLDLQA